MRDWTSLVYQIEREELYLKDNYDFFRDKIVYMNKFSDLIPDNPATEEMTTSMETFTFDHLTTESVTDSNHYPSTESIIIRTSSETNSNSTVDTDNNPNNGNDSRLTILTALSVVIPVVIGIASLIIILCYRRCAASKLDEMEFIANITCKA
jgi:hypothetical protein